MIESATAGLAIIAVAVALLGASGDSAKPKAAALDAVTPPACAQASGAAPSGSTGRRPRLLMFHAGGFILPQGETIEPACARATEAGFDVVYVSYPLGNLPEAVAASERIAKREGRHGVPVYAYGDSAGGTLAALLAQHGLVEAAATYSQLTNLVAYYRRTPNPTLYKLAIAATNADLRAFSPGLHGGGSPILAMLPGQDDPALNRETKAWDRRESGVESIAVAGGHVGIGDPATYEENVGKALRWLQEQG